MAVGGPAAVPAAAPPGLCLFAAVAAARVVWAVVSTAGGRAVLAASPAGRELAVALSLFVLRDTLPARASGTPVRGVTPGHAPAHAGAGGARAALLLPPDAWRVALRALCALCGDAPSVDAFRALPAAVEAVSRLERAGRAVAADAACAAGLVARTPLGLAALAVGTSGAALADAMAARVDGDAVAAAVCLAPSLLELPAVPPPLAAALTRALGVCLQRTAAVLERPDSSDVLGAPWAATADVAGFASALERVLCLHSWHRAVLVRPALPSSAAAAAVVVIPAAAAAATAAGSGDRGREYVDRASGGSGFAAQFVYFVARAALLNESARPPPAPPAGAAGEDSAAGGGGGDGAAVRASLRARARLTPSSPRPQIALTSDAVLSFSDAHELALRLLCAATTTPLGAIAADEAWGVMDALTAVAAGSAGGSGATGAAVACAAVIVNMCVVGGVSERRLPPQLPLRESDLSEAQCVRVPHRAALLLCGVAVAAAAHAARRQRVFECGGCLLLGYAAPCSGEPCGGGSIVQRGAFELTGRDQPECTRCVRVRA